MKTELTIKGIKTVKELKLRKKLWTMVLDRMEKFDISEFPHAEIGICKFVSVVMAYNTSLFSSLPYSYNTDDRESFPELLVYKPKSTYKQWDCYWWSPSSLKAFNRRIDVVKSIISDLDGEITRRKTRLLLWKEVKTCFIKMGPINASGICLAIDLSRNKLGGSYPSPGLKTNASSYPEMQKYFPNKFWPGTTYWWEPYTAIGFKKRIEVIKSIIKDLS